MLTQFLKLFTVQYFVYICSLLFLDANTVFNPRGYHGKYLDSLLVLPNFNFLELIFAYYAVNHYHRTVSVLKQARTVHCLQRFTLGYLWAMCYKV